MGAPAIIMGIGSVFAMKGQLQAAALNAKIARRNQDMAESASADARERGLVEAGKHRVRVGRLVATQRARIASSGVDVGVGSPVDLLGSTAAMGELDALMIENNAYREAWGLEGQALNFGYQAEMAKVKGRAQAFSTGLQGMSSAFALAKKKGD